jgi:hypothetical protein
MVIKKFPALIVFPIIELNIEGYRCITFLYSLPASLTLFNGPQISDVIKKVAWMEWEASHTISFTLSLCAK